MYNKVEANDKRGRKKSKKYYSKSRTSIAESENSKLHSKIRNRMKIKDVGYKSSSSSEKKLKQSGERKDNKIELYKHMKQLLEKKYKKFTSKQDSGGKLFPERKQCDMNIFNEEVEKKDSIFSENPTKKTSSIMDSNIKDKDSGSVGQDEKQVKSYTSTPNTMQERKTEINSKKILISENNKVQNITTKPKKQTIEETDIHKRKLDRDSPILELPDGKKLQKDERNEKNVSSEKSENPGRFKISQRLESLARHRELPHQVKKDLAYKPFKISRKALLFRDNPCILKQESNENRSINAKKGHEKGLNKVFETNKKHFVHNRKRRRLLKSSKYCLPTPRILELAKPVIKKPPMNILPPEKVFTVKKSALKAKCSKRIIELSFPVLRHEDFRIRTNNYMSTIKRRALRAKCTRRVKELAKPLPRRCRTAIGKKVKDVRAEG